MTNVVITRIVVKNFSMVAKIIFEKASELNLVDGVNDFLFQELYKKTFDSDEVNDNYMVENVGAKWISVEEIRANENGDYELDILSGWSFPFQYLQRIVNEFSDCYIIGRMISDEVYGDAYFLLDSGGYIIQKVDTIALEDNKVEDIIERIDSSNKKIHEIQAYGMLFLEELYQKNNLQLNKYQKNNLQLNKYQQKKEVKDNSLNQKSIKKFNNETLRDAVYEWLYYREDAQEKFGPIEAWDVSEVTDMRGLFADSREINIGDISDWDVSKVTDMSGMFQAAWAFNTDISGWDVSNVTNMSKMFSGAEDFNADISGWDVSNVTNMHRMFNGAKTFNADISAWDVSKVTNKEDIFLATDSLEEKHKCFKDELSTNDSSDYEGFMHSLDKVSEISNQMHEYYKNEYISDLEFLKHIVTDSTKPHMSRVFGAKRWSTYENDMEVLIEKYSSNELHLEFFLFNLFYETQVDQCIQRYFSHALQQWRVSKLIYNFAGLSENAEHPMWILETPSLFGVNFEHINEWHVNARVQNSMMVDFDHLEESLNLADLFFHLRQSENMFMDHKIAEWIKNAINVRFNF